MKPMKKNILTIGTAVMVTASLALAAFASAADIPAGADADNAPVAVEISAPDFVYDDGITAGTITVVGIAD